MLHDEDTSVQLVFLAYYLSLIGSQGFEFAKSQEHWANIDLYEHILMSKSIPYNE